MRCAFKRVKQCEITGGAASVMMPWRQSDGTTIHPSASRSVMFVDFCARDS